MSDLISRQAAIDEVINLWADKPFGNPALVEIKDCIEKLPSAQPERKRGHWVGIDDEPCETWECDKCGYIQECFEDERPNFCPQCGSDMRKSNDGQV